MLGSVILMREWQQSKHRIKNYPQRGAKKTGRGNSKIDYGVLVLKIVGGKEEEANDA